MAAVSLRRKVATTTVAAIAIALVPAAVSLAAPSAFAASSITTDPKPDGSNVVAANRPTIIATFSDTLASGSISLTENGGSTTNLCGTPVVSGKTVTCQPTADLDKTKKYDAVGNGTDSSGAKAKTSTLTFTVDYPLLDGPNSSPIPNGTYVDGSQDLIATFDEGVIGDTNTFHANGAFKLFEINADGSRGTQLGGAISFGGDPIQGSDGTVTFNPAASLSNGRYEAMVLVNGVAGSGPMQTANPKAFGRADYSVFVNNSAPFNLSTPPYANTANNTAFPFTGFAAPGLTINVSLTDSKDPNPLTNGYSGSATVDPCPSAPSCPWTVPVDISGFTDQTGVTWTAQGEDANAKTTAKATGPAFIVDYSAPPTVTVNPAPAISGDSKTVTVNAQDTATDVTSYLVTITDPEGNKLTPTIPAQNHNLPPTPIDVTPLDDGQLSITIQAVDSPAGNVSDPGGSQPYHVTKNVGLLPNLGTSILSSGGTDTTFLDAQQRSVQSPDKITVGFTQSIKQSYQDQTTAPPAPHDSSMCIASQNGNCLASNTATVNTDNRSISMTMKNPLADGTYEVRVTTYSAGNCPNKTVQNTTPPPGSWKCESFGGIVTDPNTGQPFQFTVDSSKPTIAITSFTNPVTAQNEHSVSIVGTVSKAATSVQLIIKSSGSTTSKLLYTATITPRGNSSDPDADWSSTGLDLSSLPDGTLTIKATAKKSNGTSASAIAHAKMQAHISHLTETPSSSKVTYGHGVSISGHLTNETGAAIAGEDVTVRPKFASGHFGKAVTVVTNSGGGYTAPFKPKHNATYYATYAGSPEHDGAKVHTAHISVRFHVTITSPKFGAHVSSPVTITGSVKPGHAGAFVTIFRHTASGNAVVGKARLNKLSRFSASVVLPAGTDKIFASVKKTAGNLAGKSKLLTLHVS